MIIVETSLENGLGNLVAFRLDGTVNPEVGSFARSALFAPVLTGAPPFVCSMPPVGSENFWYPIANSNYGPCGQQVDVGTIFSVDSPSRLPKPCFQDTLRGSLLGTCDGLVIKPSFRCRLKPSSLDQRYLSNGNVMPLDGGVPALTTSQVDYDRHRQLVNAGLRADYLNQYWNNTYFCPPSSVESPYSSFTASAGDLSRDSFFYSHPGSMLNPLRAEHRSVSRPSLYVWEELWIVENYHNTLYVSQSPYSQYTGYGYINASVVRRRRYTLTHVQSIQATRFRGRFEVEEDCDWYQSVFRLGGNTATSGSCRRKFTYDTQLLNLDQRYCPNSGLDLSACNDFCRDMSDSHSATFSEQCELASREVAYCDRSGLDANWLENLTQVGGLASLLVPLTEGFTAYKTGNLAYAKSALKNAYLSYLYIARPSVQDVKELGSKKDVLATAFRSNKGSERRRGSSRLRVTYDTREFLSEYFTTLHLVPRGNPWARLVRGLDSLGILPDAGRIWDCVPFSFVVDWFISFGDAIKACAMRANSIIGCNIRSRIETFKSSTILTTEDLIRCGISPDGVITPIRSVRYDRRVFDSYGDISPSFFDTTSGLTASQVAQGVALLS